MKDFGLFKPFNLPVGSGKGVGKVLGDKALFSLGGSDGFRTRIVPLPTGGQLRIRTKNGMPEYIYEPSKAIGDIPDVRMVVSASLTAKFSDMYMTSGAYTFGPLGGINSTDPMLTIEPVTYKSDAVALAEAVILTPLYDKDPPDSGEVSKIYNHTVNPGGLNSPKAVMWSSRPSEFSGLMRRCMQARYGVGNTSNDMTLPEVGGGITVGSSFSRTTGILRFGDKYFFVALNSGGGGMYGHYWPLHFPEDVAELMVSGYGAEVETLCLAYAYVDPEEVAFFGNYDIAYGETISYGWIFSLTTNKATCVVNEMLAYGYDRRMYRLMSLSFSYDEVNGVSLTYALEEEVDGWITPAMAPIWSPSGSETIWYNERLTSPVPPTAQNFPVHSFYAGDALRVVRWQYSSSTKTFNSDAFNLRCSQEALDNSVYGSGVCSYNQEEDYGTLSTHGFLITGGVSVVQTIGTSFTRRSDTITVLVDSDPSELPPTPYSVGFQTDCYFDMALSGSSRTSFNKQLTISPVTYEKGSSPPDPHPGNHWSVWKTGRATISNGLSLSDTGSGGAHTTALVIPANDCSACYIGYKKSRSIARAATSYTGSVGSSYVTEWYGRYVDTDGNGSTDTFVISGVWYPTVYRQVSLALPYHTVNSATIVRVDSSFTEEGVSIVLQSNDALTVGGTDSEIFHPGAFNNVLSQQVHVLSSSLHTDKLYCKNTLSGGEVGTTSGYPNEITLFVGAS